MVSPEAKRIINELESGELKMKNVPEEFALDSNIVTKSWMNHFPFQIIIEDLHLQTFYHSLHFSIPAQLTLVPQDKKQARKYPFY